MLAKYTCCYGNRHCLTRLLGAARVSTAITQARKDRFLDTVKLKYGELCLEIF